MLKSCIIFAQAPGALVELCGISVLERLLRTLRRCGFNRVTIRSNTREILQKSLARPSWPRAGLTIGFSPVEGPNENVLAIRGDTVFDERLLLELKLADRPVALFDRGEFCGAAMLPASWLLGADTLETAIAGRAIAKIEIGNLPTYSAKLRRECTPFCLRASTANDKKPLERIILNAAQKGTLDLPAIVHAPIENFFVARLCRTSITPNQLTVFSNIVAWLATACFATGRLVFGTILALAVGVLDGLDGKLARVKVETSDAGKLEHWFDALFEVSWWLAIAFSLQKSGALPSAFAVFFLLIGAEAIDGIAKASVIATRKKLIDEMSSFDRLVRLFGGRRNIYVWIFAIGLILGVPAKAFVVIAWWEVITAALHVPRAIGLALFRPRK